MEKMQTKVRRLGIAMCAIGILALFVSLGGRDDGRFHLYFFDVGQGDSVFIQTPEEYEILVDGGPKNRVMTELSSAMGFSDRYIDLVVLTHPHADHAGGLAEVLKKYEIGAVMLTGLVYENSYYDEILKVIQEKKIPVIFADERQDFDFGTVKIDTIYPINSMVNQNIENTNNSSIVMSVKYKETTILLTGDIEKEVEQKLMDSYVNLQADILKVGHHGSKTSSTIDFLAKVKPEIAVIQCGIDNMFGHPHAQTLENLKNAGVKQVYRNDLDGTVELILP